MRDAVFRLISDDPTLNAAPFSIDEDCVFPTFAMDGTRTVAAIIGGLEVDGNERHAGREQGHG